jgi:hypothetical protein
MFEAQITCSQLKMTLNLCLLDSRHIYSLTTTVLIAQEKVRSGPLIIYLLLLIASTRNLLQKDVSSFGK